MRAARFLPVLLCLAVVITCLGTTDTTVMSHARAQHTATLLPNGKILVLGGVETGQVLAQAELYDPSINTWSSAGSLTEARAQHVALLLTNGKVLVAGGAGEAGPLASAALYDPTTNAWQPAGSLTQARSGAAAVRLDDGRVLIAGGADANGALATTELFDPATGTFSPGAPMTEARQDFTATALPSGKVLVVGGLGADPAQASALRSSPPLATAELYDPAANTWAPASSLADARAHHTATLLADGQVLVVGGSGVSGPLATSERFDPATGSWTTATGLAFARTDHAAVLLPNGQVLVDGGRDGAGVVLSQGELYTPATNSWIPGPADSRALHTLTLLANGRALAVGGTSGEVELNTASALFSDTARRTPVGPLAEARAEHTATALVDGTVLVAGGAAIDFNSGDAGEPLATAERFDSSTRTWSSTGSMQVGRMSHRATLLADGTVLMTGGIIDGGLATSSVEAFDPATETFSPLPGMGVARAAHSATRLHSGKVLVVGGVNEDGVIGSAELFDPQSGTWLDAGTLATPRALQAAVLLPTGNVLIAGGIGADGGSLQSAELFHPSTGAFTSAGSLPQPSAPVSAVVLPDGRAVIGVGLNFDGSNPPGPDLYDPATNVWSVLPGVTLVGRAALLSNGEVLLAHPSGLPIPDLLCNAALGVCDELGQSFQIGLSVAPVSSAVPPDPTLLAIGAPTATPLASGEVLMAGGFDSQGASTPASDVFGEGAQAAWRPTLDDPGALPAGSSVQVSGALLEGLSRRGVPSFALRSLLSGRLTPVPVTAYTESSATLALPALFTGPYQLTVTVNGISGGRVVTVVGNGLPIASDLDLVVPAGQPISFTVGASDPEDDVLTYQVVLAPEHGTLSGTAPELTYTPEAGYAGPDRFRFQASDGRSTSNVGTVTLSIAAGNQAPRAISRTLAVAVDSPLSVTLSATDPDGDALTYAVTAEPKHGTLSGDAPKLTYTPAPGYVGADTITFQANDGTSNSTAGTISISVVQVETPKAPAPRGAVGCSSTGSGGGAAAAFLALGLLALGLRRRAA